MRPKISAVKRSIAYPIYDLALLATLFLAFPIAIAAVDARSDKVLRYVMALADVWILTGVTAVFSGVSPAQYLRSLREQD